MIKTKSTEGHYTIKRVDKLPKEGNANWLFVIRGPIIDKLYRWDIYSKEWEIIHLNSQGFIPGDTILDFNSQTNELSLQFSDGTVITTILDIPGTITTYEDTLTTDKNKIGQYTNEEGAVIDIFETTTNLTVEGNEIVYTKEDGTEAREDLSFIIQQAQDLNVVSGTYVENMSTIVLTKNNGDNVSITLTGLGGSSLTTVVSLTTGNTIATIDNGTVITNIEETVTSLVKNGTSLEYTKEDGTIETIDISNTNETLTTLQLANNTLQYLDEKGIQTDIDLTTYLGGSNLSRIESGTLVSNILTLTRGDNTEIQIDLSSLSGGGSGGGIQSIVAGDNITVDNTDSSNPIISSSLPVGFYEEGVFTPVVIDTTGGATYIVNYTGVKGSYVRVGNSVTIHITLPSIIQTGTPNGRLSVTGLPFATKSNSQVPSLNLTAFRGSTLTQDEVVAITPIIDIDAIFFHIFDATQSNQTFMPTVNFSGNSRIDITGTYTSEVYTN